MLPSFAGGGAERVVLTVASRLDPGRFSARLIVLDGQGPLAPLVAPHIPLVDLATPRLRRALPALAHSLRRDPPQVVFSTLAYLNFGVLALRRRLPGGIRFVVREANLPLVHAGGVSRRLQRFAYRRLYPRADIVLCPSRRVREGLEALVPRIADKLRVIANPVDAANIRRLAAATQRAPGAGLRLVAAGRLTWQKGFDRLIGMMPAFPTDAHVTILGDGPDKDALLAQARQAGVGDRLTVAGYVENPWAYMAGADAFLLPSRWEGLPNAALEALACGTRVIAAPEAGGIDEIAEAAPGNVALAPVGEAFVREVCGLAARGEASSLRNSLLPRQYTLEAAMDAYTELLDQVAQ